VVSEFNCVRSHDWRAHSPWSETLDTALPQSRLDSLWVGEPCAELSGAREATLFTPPLPEAGSDPVSEAVGLPPSPSGVLRKGMAGSVWTVFSRTIGFGRTIAIGAVLGATYLGNTYQATNALPNLVYYQLLAGSLFAALLVPPLVRHLEQRDRHAAQHLVEALFGSFLVAAGIFSVLLVAAGPLVMRLVTVGVSDPRVASAQSRVGWILLVMFVPQITLYLIAGTGAAIMNADGRFALAAAAPALESLGMIVVLMLVWLSFPPHAGLSDVPYTQLLLLGLGTTAAVGVHAACQWMGARSSGITIKPRWVRRDPEVKVVIRRALPMLAFTGMEALQILAVIVVANRIRGGIVAFQLALNFFFLPTAIVTWPLARALLPQLSKCHQGADLVSFRHELNRGVCVATFVTLPIAAAYVAFAWPIARAIAFGRLHATGGVSLMAPAIAALALAVVGETWYILATYACYARHDVRTPLRCMIVRVGVGLSLMVLAMLSRGDIVLVLLGLSLSIGSVCGALCMARHLQSRLPKVGPSMALSVARTAGFSALMVVPGVLIMLLVGNPPESKLLQIGELGGLLALSAGTYLLLQRLTHSPEVGWLKSAFVGRRNPDFAAARP
jgi:putative peptidoglycan lipid II flippase